MAFNAAGNSGKGAFLSGATFLSGLGLGLGLGFWWRREGRARPSELFEGTRSPGGRQDRPIGQVMTKFPIVCTAETSLVDLAKRMVDNDCGAIPIVEDMGERRPIGIVTDRDIVVRTLGENRNPLELSARDCMTATTVTLPEAATVDAALDLMRDHKIRRLLVVDDGGSVVGIVAQADLALEASPEATHELLEEVSAAAGSTEGPVAA